MRPQAAGRGIPPSGRKDGRPHHSLFRGEGRTTFLPRSGPNLSLWPKAALLSKALPSAKHSAPRARDGRPHHLFFRKRDGAAWRYQRKIVGAKQLVVLPEAEIRPDTPLSSQEAPSPSQNPPSKKKGFTGEHGSPVKSRAARDAVPHCISAEMPRLSPWRVLSWTAPAARSLFSAAKPLRRFCAAPRVRRSTQGAPVWGDRSLSN